MVVGVSEISARAGHGSGDDVARPEKAGDRHSADARVRVEISPDRDAGEFGAAADRE